MIAVSSPDPARKAIPGFRSIRAGESRVDVLVAGAGPAGATAARTLAAAGVRVLMLDRSSFPRNKPCGGGISVRVLKRFPYLQDALTNIATHQLARLYLEGPDGHSTIIESDEPVALMIRRVEFDALLVSLALDAGAELISGVELIQAREESDRVVLVARDGRQFAAPIVIAADGVNSLVGRRLGVNPGWAPTQIALDMMEETPRQTLRDIDPTTLWVAFGFNLGDDRAVKGTRAPEGYAYIFPKRDHVNIGIGYVLSYFKDVIDEAPYDLQRGFVERLRVRGIVAGESVRGNFTPFLIPVAGPLSQPGRGRMLVAGDAGGFVNALTAEGIYYAMVSGDLAGRTIAGSRDIATLARRYARACRDEIGAELRDSVLIQRYLFADRRRITRMIEGAHGAPALTRLILDLAIGRRSYRDVRRRLFARSPLLAVRHIWQRVAARNALLRDRSLTRI